MGAKKTATFVIPCLNERETLPKLLDEAQQAFASQSQIDWQVVVADNGSTDGSPEIAREKGAKVISIRERGYGAAVHGGILSAETDYVAYADADGTYAPADAVKLAEALDRSDGDLVLGTRLKGFIERGAMPFLHRYLGTPVLSWLLRRLHGVPTSDCNSGIRCVRRSSYVSWQPMSPGMEFASLMLIRARESGAKILEFPVHLRRSPPGREPHLRTWRDGMRHLLIVLSLAPHMFWRVGLAIMALSALITSLGLLNSVQLGPWGFGEHTLALAISIGYFGSFMLNLALMIYAKVPDKAPALVKRLINLDEGILLWSLAVLVLGLVACVGWLFWQWAELDFGGLPYTRFALGAVYFEVMGLSIILGLFQVHLVKRLKP